MKLTKLSKILISIFSIIFAYGLIYLIFSIYYINNNEAILNINTGNLSDTPGFTICSYKNNIKFTKYYNILSGTLPVVLQNKENKFFKFKIYIEYDYNWIQTNKKLPNLLIIPIGEIENYMLNETLKLNTNYINPDTLKNLIYNFYSNKLNNSGYKINNIFIITQLLSVDEIKYLH